MEISKEELAQRLQEQDYLFYFRYISFGCCNNEITEELMLFAIKDKIIAYNGRDHHIPMVSPWQYEKIVRKISKYTKSWDIKNEYKAPLIVVINFDGVPRTYCGDSREFKNFRKLHKIVDCVRKGFTIL